MDGGARPPVCPIRTILVYLPDTAATITDRISQRSHHDWIEAFLVSTARCAQLSSSTAAPRDPLAPKRLPC